MWNAEQCEMRNTTQCEMGTATQCEMANAMHDTQLERRMAVVGRMAYPAYK